MRQLLIVGILSLIPALSLQAADYVTVKGKFVWDKAGKGEAPKQVPIKPTKDEEVCVKDKDFNTEEWVINPKNLGIKNVVVWILPEPDAAVLAALLAPGSKVKELPVFDKKDIHPALAKPAKEVVIDQPCCRFIPHITLAQTGQEMLIKNSADVPHNAKWTSRENGEINPLIPSKGEYRLAAPLVAERFPIEITCSIHPWMKAWVRVFDHPYFAITDADGNFEIKNLPVLKGKLRYLAWQAEGGLHKDVPGKAGTSFDVKAGEVNLGEIKYDFKQK